MKSLPFRPDTPRIHSGARGARLLSPMSNGEPVRPVAFLLKSSLIRTLCFLQSQGNSCGFFKKSSLLLELAFGIGFH